MTSIQDFCDCACKCFCVVCVCNFAQEDVAFWPVPSPWKEEGHTHHFNIFTEFLLIFLILLKYSILRILIISLTKIGNSLIGFNMTSSSKKVK